MRLIRHADAGAFLAAAAGFLAEQEAIRNVAIGVARTCVADPSRYPGPNYFAVIEAASRICGAAVMTPPHPLGLHVPSGRAIEAVAADLDSGGWSPSGVTGPADTADEFAALWCERRGLRAGHARSLRAFELSAVIPAPPTNGRMRLAGEADLPVVAAWFESFQAEAGVPGGSVSSADAGRRAVRDGRAFLWDAGGPVAQAVIGGTTPNGARIGGVYTPPARRCRGYATALVGALSQHVLDGGKRFCFLFTDLANPVSNSIYPKVGYRPVADFHEFVFTGE